MPTAIRLPALSALVAGLSLACAAAWAGEIRGVALQAGSTGTHAEIQLAGGGSYKTLSLSAPNRLVVDFPDSSAVRGLKLPAATGVVTAIRTGNPVPGTFRVVFDLTDSVKAFKPQMQATGAESKLVIEWPGDAPATTTTAAAPPPPVTPQPVSTANDAAARAEAARATAALTASVLQQANAPTTATTAQENRPSPAAILNGQTVATGVPAPTMATAVQTPAAEPPAPRPVMPSDASRITMQPGMRTLVVAIDPGHGGQDPGAIGPTGKREKDVTLAVARELARQVNATPGLRAYLTRDTDMFIPLPMRAQRARAAKADIFISIHADAAENRSATGSSVYVLSTKGASSQRARWLADKENAADLIGGVSLKRTEGTLANVLLDLAQSGYMKASEDAAGHVLGGLKRIGNNHKPNLERANFAVLRTSDMPAMLVETAFISNPDEERRLIDPAYQRRIAGAVLDGVHTFFSRQPPPGTLFAARAQAEMEAAAGTVAGGSK
ncbi:MAG: N-acetylmuramoyl-L-alanine amidase [Stenotrophomonas sp.]